MYNPYFGAEPKVHKALPSSLYSPQNTRKGSSLRFLQGEYISLPCLAVFYKYPSGLSTKKTVEMQSSLRAFPILMIE